MAQVPPIFPSGDPEARAALRALLHRAADAVADYLGGLGDRPIFPAQPQAPAGELLPEHGEPLEHVFGAAAHWAVENSVHVGHPGYAGHMDSGVAVAGVLADFLAGALNQNLLAFELAPGATLLEKGLIQAFARLAGLPEGAGGLFTTGGTTANLTALLLARDAASRDGSRVGLSAERPLGVLCSRDAHYSIHKAAAVLGLGSERVLAVPVAPPERRLDPGALEGVYRGAVERGIRPVALVATAGTTSCGAIDPIGACADFCEEHGLWLHVDAALSGPLLFHPQERARLAGIQRADSIALDPHKWLYASKCAGILLVRNGRDLVPARYEAPYLDRFTSHGEALPVSQGRRSLEGSRRFDALKVWMILRHLGRRGVAALLEDRLRMTRWFHQALSEHPFFFPCHIPDSNVQAFAPRERAEEGRVAAAHRALETGGRLWSSYTRLDGRPCHRVVLLNPSGTEQHLRGILEGLEAGHRHGGPIPALLQSSPPADPARPQPGWCSIPRPHDPPPQHDRP
ncbi:MAG: aspartate aminotransferase family protein [Planctomycetota bacterium]|nr:MAG: aspartate aminotransferase family protein [Planctomycetota bacterium]